LSLFSPDLKERKIWRIGGSGTRTPSTNIVVDDHAYITAANKLDGRHQELYQLSCQLVRDLVREHTHDRPAGGWKGGEGWLKKFMNRLRELILGNFSMKKDIVTVFTTRCGMPRA
jgi:hypothetical protein